jgi:plasmid stabilization system protein ParE
VKPTIFHPQADDDFAEAVARYAGKAPGLGDRFYDTVLRLVAEIEAAPQLHRPWRHGTRRHFKPEFPYALIYVERPDRIIVLAVAHFKRRPDFWRERLG